MSKIVKWTIGVIGILIALIVIISLSLPLFIDPNDYKDTIAKKVREQTGRELSIPGDIKLDVSLIGLKTVFSLGDINLSSSKDFPGTEFFSSKLAEINLALWPLITKKELMVNKIILKGVNINLVRNKDGAGSWDDLAGDRQPQPEKKPADRAKDIPKDKSGKGLAAIDIGAIQGRDINFTYVDNQVGRTVKLSNFNLDVGHIRNGKSFPLKASFDLFHEDSQKKSVSAAVDTKSNFTFFTAQQHFIIDGFNCKGLVQGVPASGQELDLEVSADIDLELQKQKIEIKKLAIRQGEMQIKTILTLAGFSDPQLTGSLEVLEFSPRAQAESLGMTLPLEDPKSLSQMSGEIDFSGNMNELQVKKLTLNLDDTTVNGTASVKNILNPAYDLVLHINQLDLDRYKMVKKVEQAQEASPATPRSPQKEQDGDQIIIPAEQLRNLTFSAEIKIDKLKAAKLNIANIQLKASGSEGLIKLDPFAADMYEGTVTVTGDLDARPDIPKMHFIKELQGVQLGPMFMDMKGKEEIKGRADIHADLTTNGMTKNELTRNANGKMTLSLADGEIAKLKIIDTIRTAKALIGSQKEEEKQPDTAQQTDAGKEPSKENKSSGRPTTFASLTATGVITNGVFKNNDLLAESELMKVTGKGTVNMVTEQVDYLLTIYLAKYLERDEKSGLVELADRPIPYRVKGTFDKIAQSAALEKLLVDEGKKLLIKELGKQFGGDTQKDGDKKESSDSTEDLINKGLKSLFGN